MNNSHPSHIDLQAMAREVMIQNGFQPEFPPAVDQQLAQINSQPKAASSDVRDLRNLLWSSIDNDTSRDLDQIEVAQKLPDGSTKVMIGIADVDAFVPFGSPIDQHAAKETTTVYTGIRNFPMLPEKLSTGITSLLENNDALSIVIEFNVDTQGQVTAPNFYRALVRNKAQLQNDAAQALKKERYRHGALNIETTEVKPVVLNEQVVDLVRQQKNRATDLIEDFMIAANGVVALTLETNKIASIRRVVKTPERWDRIVELAGQQGGKLPAQPDSKALNDFLQARKAADPDHFADLSLAVIKLMGPGEYVMERPGEPAPGHFGLAVQNYTHSTAPNRRFADVVTQRLIKAVMQGKA